VEIEQAVGAGTACFDYRNRVGYKFAVFLGPVRLGCRVGFVHLCANPSVASIKTRRCAFAPYQVVPSWSCTVRPVESGVSNPR